MKKQNIQAEIDFFDKIIEYDDSFSEREYKIIFDKIAPYLNGYMLEAGCSSGSFGVRTKQLRPNLYIVGVDINQKFINLAQERNVYDKLLCANLEDRILFNKSEFNTVFCPFVLHHLPDLKNTIDNLDFWLKPGGYLIIVDPNGSNLILRMSYLLRKILFKFINNVKNYASINESNKSVASFKKCLKNYEICFIETFNRDSNIKLNSISFFLIYLLSFIRKVLLMAYRAIPFLKYSGSDLIIVARKKPTE